MTRATTALVAVLAIAAAAPAVAAGAGSPWRAGAPSAGPPSLPGGSGAAGASVGESRAVDARTSFGARFVRYRQFVGGLPVLGSDAVATDLPGRRADVVIGAARTAVRRPPRATVGGARAVAAARRHVGVTALRAPIERSLAIEVAGGRPRVVWRVLIPSARPLASYEVLVDARDARVTGVRDLLRRAFVATGQGSVFDTNPVVAQGSRAGLADAGDSDSPALTALREEVALPRLDDAAPGCLEGRWAHVTIPSGEVCDDPDRDFRALTRSDDAFEAVMAYFHVDRTQSHLQSLGFADVRDAQQRVRANEILTDEDGDPLPPGEQDNSYYDPVTGAIALGSGGTDDGEDGEVIVHEYGHAIQDDQVPGWGASDEGGAMGEGFGDYLAAAIARTYAPGAAFDPCVAEWDELGFGSPEAVPCLRRVDRDLTAAQVGPGSACDGEVHCAGEAWSGALWDVRAQIGAATADRLVVQSHFSLTPTAGFHDGALALLAADQALYGGVHVAFLRDLLAARGLLDVERLDDQPGGATPLALPGEASGSVDAADDPDDVYALALPAGGGVLLRLTAPAGELDLRLLRPGATSVDDATAVVAAAESGGPNETLSFTPSASGVHYLDVRAVAGGGTYAVAALPDRDSDLRADGEDNCPAVANSGQADGDRDGSGDPCDPFPGDPANDRDGDGIAAGDDNCPTVANARQGDWDGDGRGDVCDRSARVALRRVRVIRRKVVLRATLRPDLLAPRAVRIAVSRRVCGGRRCAWRPVDARVRARRAGRGQVRLALTLPRGGGYRVRARVADRAYARARSRAVAVTVD